MTTELIPQHGAAFGCVILTYGSADPSPLVRAVEAAGFNKDGVVVVHNPSPKNPEPARAEVLPRLVVCPTNGGYGAGMNAGIAELRDMRCRFYLLITAGVELDPIGLKAATEKLESDIGVLGPVLRDPRAGNVISSGGRLSRTFRPTHRTSSSSVTGVADVDWVDGAALFVNSNLVPLPEEYFLYWEDVALSLKARQHGLRRCVVEGWEVLTEPGASSRPDVFRYLYWRNRIHCSRTYGSWFAKVATLLAWAAAVAARPARTLANGSPVGAARTAGILVLAGWDAARKNLGPPGPYVLRGSDVALEYPSP